LIDEPVSRCASTYRRWAVTGAGHGDIGRALLDGNRYMTIATADGAGVPWPSPVYFTPHKYRELYWVSSCEAQHSRNIATRGQIGVVVFDSTVEIGAASALYLEANAGEVPAGELADAVRIAFTPRFPGVGAFSVNELRPPGLLRLYRATITAASILKPRFDRLEDELDHRIPISLTMT
jgi:hypothetical protein